MPVLCFLGMGGIGVASLRRAYASTIRAYTGQDGRGRTHANVSVTDNAIVPSEAEATKKAKRLFVSRSIPGLSDRLSGVVLSNLINLIRAPETKMALIGPVIMIGVLMVFLLMGRIPSVPAAYGPLVWLGAIATLLFFCLTLNLNTFGMDRDGFRSYVLMPVERHEILIGKNLSTMPLLTMIAALFAICMFWIAAIGPLVFLATLFQFACGLTMASLLGNWVSILFPMALSPGTGKPVHINFVTVVVQVLVIILVPCLLLPGMAFIGLEWWVQTKLVGGCACLSLAVNRRNGAGMDAIQDGRSAPRSLASVAGDKDIGRAFQALRVAVDCVRLAVRRKMLETTYRIKPLASSTFEDLRHPVTIIGEGKPMLLVHGYPLTRQMWNRVWEPLVANSK